jgi:hypothetical protein
VRSAAPETRASGLVLCSDVCPCSHCMHVNDAAPWCRDQASRWSPLEALQHRWLKRAPAPGKAADAPTGVIQRIQRFGGFSEFKRGALEEIAKRFVGQSDNYACKTGRISRDWSLAAPLERSRRTSEDSHASHASTAPNPDDTQRLNFTRTKPSPSLEASATMGAQRIVGKLRGRGPPSMKRAKGLLEHLMVDNGAVRARRRNAPCSHVAPVATDAPMVQIDRFSLADGLKALGYDLADGDLDHLLSQLLAVPGLTTSTAVTSASLAASQMDVTGGEEWAEIARAAFNVLDLDGDGKVQRSEMEVVLSGRCPDEVRPGALATLPVLLLFPLQSRLSLRRLHGPQRRLPLALTCSAAQVPARVPSGCRRSITAS